MPLNIRDGLVFALAAGCTLAARLTGDRGTKAFSYSKQTFYIEGRPFQILGGQIDPQRVPRELWRDRLEKAKAMGLNTIFSYIYWNELEPYPGTWDWYGIGGMNDIGLWYKTISEVGLHAVLRPGPYVCGERDWGGFPAWLSQVSNREFDVNIYINGENAYYCMELYSHSTD